MTSYKEYLESKFLKKEDVMGQQGHGVLVTINAIQEQDVAMTGESEQIKLCAYFNELGKGLVLNSTNMQALAELTGSEEIEDWIGHQVVLYADQTIMFRGKRVGGIRLRAPRIRASGIAGTARPSGPAPAARNGMNPARPAHLPQVPQRRRVDPAAPAVETETVVPGYHEQQAAEQVQQRPSRQPPARETAPDPTGPPVSPADMDDDILF